MRHVLSALVTNQPGVLAHISGMLASRGFNIDSLAVGETENPDFSRITFVVHGDDRVLDQVRKQLVGICLKGPGMHWRERGALAVTALRAHYLNDNWHHFWSTLTLAP